MSLTSAQQSAIDPYSHCWVKANAGSGKTKVLIDRILALLLEGVAPHKIVCLTFTKAIAAEMQKRLSELIFTISMMDSAEKATYLSNLFGRHFTPKHLSRLQELLHEYPNNPVNIQTIHAFCHTLLSSFPFESELMPSFSLMDDIASSYLLEKALKRVLRESQHAVVGNLFKQARLEDLVNDLKNYSSRLRKVLYLKDMRTYESFIENFLNLNEKIDYPLLRLNDEEREILENGNKTEIKICESLTESFCTLEERIEALRSVFLYASGERMDSPKESFLSKKNSEKYPLLEEKLLKYACELELYIDYEKSLIFKEENVSLMAFINDVFKEYENLKKKQGQLDFQDLITQAKNLLVQKDFFPWVEMKLGYKVHHLLIDEAQDTTPDQWSIIQDLLDHAFQCSIEIHNHCSVFAVGDPKQSIYSFQDAEPSLFSINQPQEIKSKMLNHHHWKDIQLQLSFRTNTSILQCVDAVFKNTEASEGISFHQAEELAHDAYFNERLGSVTLYPLFMPTDQGEQKEWQIPDKIYPHPVNEYAQWIVEKIEETLNSGLYLESHQQIAKPEHILILFQKRSPLFYTVIDFLQKKGIPVSGPDRFLLKDNLFIRDLLAIAQFVNLPEDDLNLAGLLKSPLFSLSEENLFDLCYGRERSLWKVIQEKDPDLSNRLNAIIVAYNEHPTLYDFFHHILYNLSYISCFKVFFHDTAFLCQVFFETIDSFNTSGIMGLPQFIQSFNDLNLEVSAPHAPETIRVMTVHGAKGLEAPVVFLPDTTSLPSAHDSFLWLYDKYKTPISFFLNPNQKDSPKKIKEIKSLHKSNQMKEYYRLLYVAMTRACDHLHVMGFNKSPENAWYSLIQKGLSCLHQESDPQSTITWGSSKNLVVPASTFPENTDKLNFIIPEPLKHKPEDSKSSEAQFGINVHSYLEALTHTHEEEWDTIEDFPELDKKFLQNSYRRHIVPLLQGGTAYVEMPLSGLVEGKFASVRLDLVIMNDHKIHIIDYKTSPYNEQTLTQYKHQSRKYALLLQNLYPEKKIESSILWILDDIMSPLDLVLN